MEDKSNSTNPLVLRNIIIAITLFMAAVTLGPMLYRHLQEQKLLKNGDPGQATIVRLAETGSYVNNKPRMEITLEIEVEGDEPYTAKTTKILSPLELKRYDVGALVNIRVSASDRKRVAIVGLTKRPPRADADPAEERP